MPAILPLPSMQSQSGSREHHWCVLRHQARSGYVPLPYSSRGAGTITRATRSEEPPRNQSVFDDYRAQPTPRRRSVTCSARGAGGRVTRAAAGFVASLVVASVVSARASSRRLRFSAAAGVARDALDRPDRGLPDRRHIKLAGDWNKEDRLYLAVRLWNRGRCNHPRCRRRTDNGNEGKLARGAAPLQEHTRPQAARRPVQRGRTQRRHHAPRLSESSSPAPRSGMSPDEEGCFVGCPGVGGTHDQGHDHTGGQLE